MKQCKILEFWRESPAEEERILNTWLAKGWEIKAVIGEPRENYTRRIYLEKTV